MLKGTFQQVRKGGVSNVVQKRCRLKFFGVRIKILTQCFI